MKPESKRHLNEDQIIQAVVDPGDLPQSVRAHLADCRQCTAERNSFEHELTALAQNAEQLAPGPQRRILLPPPKARNPLWNLLEWRNLIAAAAAVTAVFMIVWGTNTVRNGSGPGTENLAAEMLEAERLMTEVNTLVDNALPPFYLELSGEKKSDYDEAFYRFLIPTIEDKALS
jgi:hypothetical protein